MRLFSCPCLQVDRSRNLERLFDNAMSTSSSQTMAHMGSHHYQPRYQLHPTSSQSFDMSPPGLIRDGEEGYQSLPQSPLDAVFPNSMALGATMSTGADPLAGMAKSYVDMDYTGQFDSSAAPAVLGAASAGYGHGLAHASHQGYSVSAVLSHWAACPAEKTHVG